MPNLKLAASVSIAAGPSWRQMERRLGRLVYCLMPLAFSTDAAAQVPTPTPLLPAPTIAITSPPPGQALYDVTPTITVTYSADPAVQIDLDSLSVRVNGADWAPRFSKTATSAS
jgi:hypothetical protein